MILLILMVAFFAIMGIVGVTLQGIVIALGAVLAFVIPYVIFTYLPKPIQTKILTVFSSFDEQRRKHPVRFFTLYFIGIIGGGILLGILIFYGMKIF